MNAHPTPPSSADLASEAGGLSTGLGIITFALFPVAVPGLLFVVVPLALIAVVGLLLAIPFVLPVRLIRAARRRQSRKAGAGMLPGRQPAESTASKLRAARSRSRLNAQP